MPTKSRRLVAISRFHRARGLAPGKRLLRLEPLENREMLAIDLISAVGDPTLLGAAANGASEISQFSVSHDGRYIAFQSSASDLAGADTNRGRDVFVRDLQSGANVRVSTDSAGGQGNGNAEDPALSGDGRYVAFSSSADNLVAGDTNGKRDVFLKDLQTGVTTRVSTSTAGAQGDGKSYAPSLSYDGRYVAFASAATNLTPGDTNNLDDVFVKDLQTGLTTRVSTTAAGALADNASTNPAISADGRYVAFVSLAGNLGTGDINGLDDIYLKDIPSGAITRVSTDSGGALSNGISAHPAISGDGRYVAFSSEATNLVAGDANFAQDVFVKDLSTGLTRRVSTTAAGGEVYEKSGAPAISSDGRWVAFHSDAEELVAGDTNGDSDVFVKNLLSETITRVSTTGTGAEADGDSAESALTADGRYVVFLSDADNLAGGDTNGVMDVFLKDRQGGATTRLTPRDASVLGTFAAGGLSDHPAASGDGRYVVFESSAANLVAGDTNNDIDIFLKDRLTGTITRVSTESDGSQANDDSEDPAITPDGRYLVFSSKATDLVDGDTNGVDDVFRKDLQTGLVVLVSAPAPGGVANGDSKEPAVSADGRYVAFTSEAALVAGDTNACEDVFVKDLLSGQLTRVSVSTAGAQGLDDSQSPSISADGRYVAFESDAANLVANDTNNDTDVFIWDRLANATTRISIDTGGSNANGDSTHPSITADGRYVAFTSEATDMVAVDTNLFQDIFLWDRLGAITRVSTTSGGVQVNGDSAAPEIASGGRWLVFRSEATDLVAGDTNGQEDVFLKDLETGAVTLLSAPEGVFEANGDAASPAISGDGAYIIFASDAGNLVWGDGNELTDVFGAGNPAVNRQPTDIGLSGSQVPENAPAGTLVGTLATSDPDLGDAFTYTLAAGGADNAFFAVVGSELRAAGPFDYEDRSSYNVRIRTTDQGDLWFEKDFAIAITDVNEAPQQILAEGAMAVPENAAPGTLACSLSTVDPDLADLYTYVLIDSADGRFAVAGDQIVVAAGELLDYETSTSHVLRVRSTDQGGLFCEANVTVALTNVNEAPTDMPVAEPITVLEHSQPGTLVCNLATTDPDAGDSHDYALVDDAGGRFAVAQDQVVVADGSLLDYATAASHVIRVRTTDQGGLWHEKDLTVHVTYTNQAPTDIVAPQPVAVAENRPAGTVVCALSTSDPDSGDLHTYSLLDNAGGRFALAGSQIVVADGDLLDYEVGTEHVIRVRSTDRGGLWCEKDFTIGVADLHDFFSPALFDPGLSTFYLRASNTSGPADYTFGFGDPDSGWQVLTGDWEGDGGTGVGLYAPESSIFFLTGAYVSGYAQYTFGYGEPDAGWIPLVGDWDGDGDAGVGLYNPHASCFYLTDALQTGYAQYVFGYGEPGAGWIPLVGDWNGDGRTGVGLYDPNTSWFYLTNTLSSGYAEFMFGYGEPGAGWQPLVGDWNGDRGAGVGLYNPKASTFYLTNALATGFAEYVFGYGEPDAGWRPLVGDFDGTGGAGVGLYAPTSSTFYLTNTLQSGYAEYTIGFGSPESGAQPIVGCWTEPAKSQVSDDAPAASLDPRAVDQLLLGDLFADGLKN